MKAWQVIEKEENWCKGSNALDLYGRPVGPRDPAACKWCATGAFWKAYPSVEAARREAFLRLADLFPVETGSYADRDVAHWNDAPERTHAEVLAAMKKADV